MPLRDENLFVRKKSNSFDRRERSTGRTPRSFRTLLVEPLEARQLLSAVGFTAPANVTILAGTTYYVPLNAADAGHTVSFSAVASDYAKLTPVVMPAANKSLQMNVAVNGGSQPTQAIDFQLFDNLVPRSAAAIESLVNTGYYNGLEIYRSQAGFVFQGGNIPPGGPIKSTPVVPPMAEEFSPDIQYAQAGILGLGRTSAPNTTTPEFFVTYAAQDQAIDYNSTGLGVQTSGYGVDTALARMPVENNTGLAFLLTPVKITSATIFTDTQNGVLQLRAPAGASGVATITVTASDGVNMPTTQTFVVNIQSPELPISVPANPFASVIPTAPTGLICLSPPGTAAGQLQFQVSGVTSGNVVEVLADGQPIGQATATGSAVAVSANPTTTLSAAPHYFTAIQIAPQQTVSVNESEISGEVDLSNQTADVPSLNSPAVVVAIGEPGPQFAFTPNTTAIVGQAYSSRAATLPDASGAVTYSLATAPAGMTIDPSTGIISWAAQSVQTGSFKVIVAASDPAGHTSQYQFSLVAGNFAPPSAGLPAFVADADNADMVYDSNRDILYITTTDGILLRYSLVTGSLLPSVVLGGSLAGIDISPDQNTLAIADRSGSATDEWIDVLDLTTGMNRKITFGLEQDDTGTNSVAFVDNQTLLVAPAGTGIVSLRKVNLATGTATSIGLDSEDSLLSASADHSVVAISETTPDPADPEYYDVADGTIHRTSGYNLGPFGRTAASRDGQQFAYIASRGAHILDQNLQRLGSVYYQHSVLGAPPVPYAVAYSPVSDTVYFSWYGQPHSFIDAYDTNTFTETSVIDSSPASTDARTGVSAVHPIPWNLRISADGTLLFATVDGGINIYNLNPKTNSDLAISASASAATVMAGSGNGNMTYTFTVTNHGPTIATRVVLNDATTLEPGVSLVSAAASSGTLSFNSAGNGAWNLDSLPVGGSATLTLTLTVAANAAPGWNVIGARLAVSSADQLLINTSDDTAIATTNVAIHGGASLLPDAFDPSKITLYVGGGTLNDTIIIAPATQSGKVNLSFNGKTYGPFTVTGRIELYGWEGNDVLTVSPGVTLPAYLFAGSGSDILTGGGGNDVLVGGGGTDVLIGGAGRNLLIAGSGFARLFAGTPGVAGSTNDGSILIAGSTAYDRNTAALYAIMQAWTSSASYAQRISNLRSGAASAGYKLDKTTISASVAVDQVFASLGYDWFWDLSGKSMLSGRRAGTQLN